MTIYELLQAKRESILQIAAKYGAYNVRIFGSVARGEADLSSDVDFLVDMEPGRSLFDLGGFLMELQELLGCNVDLVTEKGLRSRIRERVLKEAISLGYTPSFLTKFKKLQQPPNLSRTISHIWTCQNPL